MGRLRLLLATAAALLAPLGAASWVVSGCSSTETGATGTTGTSGSGGDAGPPTDYCNNEADQAARLRGYCPGNRSIQEISGQCGLNCITSLDAGGCISDCLVAATDLSVPCSTCVAATVLCARDNCFNECVGDTQSKICLACRCGQNVTKHNCYDDYEHCSGTHLPDCDELDAGTWDGYAPVDGGCAAEGGGGAGGSGGGP